jgi:hypothetical protein
MCGYIERHREMDQITYGQERCVKIYTNAHKKNPGQKTTDLADVEKSVALIPCQGPAAAFHLLCDW